MEETKTNKNFSLEESNQLLNITFENSNFMIAYMDSQFNFIRVSQAYADADEKDAAFFQDKNHFVLYPNEENEKIFRAVVKTGEPYHARSKDFEYAEHPERDVSSWDWNLIPINDSHGATNLVLTLFNTTMLKKSEEALRKEKKFTDTVLDAQRDTFFVFEPATGKAIKWNKTFRELSGYSNEEIANLKAPNSYYKEEELIKTSDTNKIIEEKGTAIVELNLNTKDGRTIPFEYAGSGIFDDEGHLKYIVSIGRDITERKKSEQILKTDRDKFQAFMDGLTSSGIGIDIVSRDYKVQYQNELLKERFGDLTGESCHNKYMGLEEPCHFCPMIKALKNNSVESIELLGTDGRNYQLISAPLPNPDGTVDTAAEIVLDITDRKIAEQKLKESEEKFRTISEESLVGIGIIQDDVFKYINQILLDYIGYTPEEIKKWKPGDIFEILMHPEQREEMKEISRNNQSGESKSTNHVELNIIRKNGEKMVLDMFARSIIYQGRTAAMNICIDITDQKKAEELIIEENLKLQELSEMRQDLITRISHELKTPITSIYGASQALLVMYKKDMSDTLIEFVEIIKRGGKRLKSLVENLLDTSRLESKKIKLKLQEENIVDIIREHVNDLRYIAEDRKIEVNLNLPNELLLNIDKIRIGQVITNIVSNAINNTLSRGKVSIGINETKEHVDIIIKDTGVGITSEEIKKLFKKFGKIERFGKGYEVYTEGSGLGLFISKEFVELHGGQILVDSGGRHEGATFTIRLEKEKPM
jgi:hypothetical protein